MRKLSATQQHVVDALRNGWELGEMMTMAGGCWMQKGGLGRGGECKEVRGSTVTALFKKNIIKQKSEEFPVRVFELADAEEVE